MGLQHRNDLSYPPSSHERVQMFMAVIILRHCLPTCLKTSTSSTAFKTGNRREAAAIRDGFVRLYCPTIHQTADDLGVITLS